jgi:hypothetical protein
MLTDLINKHKKIVLKKWFDSVLDTYPAETKRFLPGQRDRFANPVAASISDGMDGILQGVADGTDLESSDFSGFLDRIIRIRAVQEFSASESLSFIFLLKTVVRETLGKEIRQQGLTEELAEFESNIDRLALVAFDKYVECREKIFEIRIREIKDSTNRTWQRICRKYGEPEQSSGPHGT